MKLRELFIEIGFDVDEKALKKIEGGLNHIKGAFLGIGVAAGAIGGGLFALAKNVANIGDNAKKTAKTLGLTTEALQELDYVAEISNVEQGELRVSLKYLARNAVDAANGVKTSAAMFKKLGGMSVTTNGKLKSTDQLLEDISREFKKMPNDGNKTAMAVDLLGRSGERLINLLNEGPEGLRKLRQEANELGYVMSEKDSAASEEFNDSLTRLFAVLRGIKIYVASAFIPELTEVITSIKLWAQENRELIRGKIKNFMLEMVKVFKMLVTFGKVLFGVFSSLITSLGGLERTIKIITFLFGLFISMKLLLGIGMLAKGIFTIVMAFKALTFAAIAAKVAMFAIPILIVAALVALALIIEDIVAYFQGRNSITGLIVDAFANKFPAAFEIARTIFLTIKQTLLDLAEIARGLTLALIGCFTLNPDMIMAGLTQIYNVFAEKFGAIKDFVIGVFTAINDYAYKILEPLFIKIQSVSDFFTSTGDKIKSLFGMNPSSAPVNNANSQTMNNTTNSARVNAPITVNVPQGTSPQEVGPHIENGIRNALENLFRQTSLSTEPQIEY